MANLIKVTLTRSRSKCTPKQLGSLDGLGLFRRGKSKILKDTVPIRGMILSVQHMLDVERFEGDDNLRNSARQRAASGSA